MDHKKLAVAATSSALVGSLLLATPALAQGRNNDNDADDLGGQRIEHVENMMLMRPVVVGTVSAINGNSITLLSAGFGRHATSTTLTVDAGAATILKNGATTTLGGIAVGDKLTVQGTITGNSVTATTIRDNMLLNQKRIKPLPPIVGNGEPVVGGTVTAVSSSTVVVTNTSNVTYTVSAASSTVVKGGTTSTLSAIAVGDKVLVQGTVNGTAVTASSIIDQGTPKTATSTEGNNGEHRGILRGIGNLLQRIFGFF